MRFIFTTAVFLSIGLIANAQDSLTTKLINSAYLEIVDSAAQYYYLLNNAPNPKFDENDLKEIPLERKNYDKTIPFDEFVSKIMTDTSTQYWQGYSFHKAIITPKVAGFQHPSIRRINYFIYNNANDSALLASRISGDIIIPLKKGISKKQRKALEKKAFAAYENIPIEEKTYFIFSKPIYSISRNYALLSLSNNQGGCIHVFKLVNGNWNRVFSWRRWIY